MRAWRLVRAKRFQKLLLLTRVYTHNPRLLHEKYQTVTFCNIQRKLLSYVCAKDLRPDSLLQDACYTVAVLQPQIESPQRMSTCDAGSV